jgi:small subunit ribosomal protein S17
MSDPSPDAGASEAAAPEELAAEPEGGMVAEATDATGAVTEAAPEAPTTPAPAAPAAASAPAPAGGSKPAQSAAADGPRANRRKVREGVVSSSSMDKTAVVKVVERVRHPRYFRTVQRTKKLYVHVESEQLKVGDRVRVVETRPLSKLKHWRLLEVLERAK